MASVQYVVSTYRWSVHSDAVPGSHKPLPRYQRRGAIIIIGMLAVAKREVVANRVETLVKVGLGDLGRVGVIILLAGLVAE